MIVVCPSCFKKNNLPDDIAVYEAQCGQCDHDLWSNQPITLNDDNFMLYVPNTELPVLVDFWAEWCGPCKQIGPALEELSEEYGEKIKIAKINVDENPNSPSKLGVRGIPALFIYKNGEMISSKIGAAPKTDLKNWIDEST